MRWLIFSFVILSAMRHVRAQEPLPQAEALKQLYPTYDAEKQKAEWQCTQEQTKSTSHYGWPCLKEYSTVLIHTLLTSLVWEAKEEKMFLVASAAPANDPAGYECHLCQPAIGVAVFAWRTGHWELQSLNPAVGFYGGWGGPPIIDIVTVGTEIHGVLISDSFLGQGYTSSYSTLLLPLAQTVSEVWRLNDESDDYGAYDPTDKFAQHIRYRSSAAFKFIAADGNNDQPAKYSDIEVLSQGMDRGGLHSSLKREDWKELFRFDGKQYRRIRHTEFTEEKQAKHPPHP